jgi:elongation factor G
MSHGAAWTLGVYGQGGAGKTTLVEAVLQVAGVLERRARPDVGPEFLDFEPEAQRHRLSVQMAVATVPGRPTLVVVDTPGYPDFLGECLLADRMVEAALLVVDGAQPLGAGTEIHARRLRALGCPLVAAVTKLDRDHGAFAERLEELVQIIGPACQALYRPTSGGAPPALALLDGGECLERVVEGDDALLAAYLEGEMPPEEALWPAVGAAVAAGRLVPVVPVSGVTGSGVAELLALLRRLPLGPATEGEPAAEVVKTLSDPHSGRLSILKVRRGVLRSDSQLRNQRTRQLERIGQLYRLNGRQREPVAALGAGEVGAVAKLQGAHTGDVYSLGEPLAVPAMAFPPANHRVVVRAKASGDEDKIAQALARQLEEDPSMRLERTGKDLQVAAYGELQVEVLVERLRRKYGVEVELALPEVPYRETIRATVKAEGKHKKQTGGHGQYGHVWLEIGPSDGEPFEFVDRIYGGAVPLQYRPAVEKGVREAMEEGVLAGYPMTGIRCVLYDGSDHPVDSSELAFKLAGQLAFRKGAKEARPVLLEPIHELLIEVPEAAMGDVLGDLNRRRGRVLGLEAVQGRQRIRAFVPQAEILRYAVELRSLTGGRASYEERFDHYEEAPPHVAQQVIARRSRAG